MNRKVAERFGKLLKTKREEKGLTLRELATKIGISHVYIYQVECGNFAPISAKRIRLAAKALDCDVFELLVSADKLGSDVADSVQKMNQADARKTWEKLEQTRG